MGFPVRKRDVNRQLYYSGRYRNEGTNDAPAWTAVRVNDNGELVESPTNVIPFPRLPNEPLAGEEPGGEFEAENDGADSELLEDLDDRREAVPEATTQPYEQSERSREVAHHEYPQLTHWQAAARRRWYRAGCRGVVEAVTGSGKTILAVAIINDELAQSRKVLVLVPTIVLAHQWQQQITRLIPEARVGMLGGGHMWVPLDCDVVVAVKNSAASHAADLAFVDTVIADECHNYAATVHRQALIATADHRLGLTATFERLDDGVREVLRPYFGDTVFKCGFDKAFGDGLLAPARIALVGVSFNGGERSEYDDAHDLMAKNRRALITRFGVPAKPFGAFMMTVGSIAKDPTDPGQTAARVYLKARTRTRDLLATAQAKTDFMLSMAPLIRESQGALLFCERIPAADLASGTYSRLGLRSAAFHSKLSQNSRISVLNSLATGHLDVLCTAKALDEGVDVPDTDLGLVAAGTQQRRQMIQRLGRVLRAKPDGRAARFVITYVIGAAEEDPAEGAHESFIRDIDDIVGDHRTFMGTQVDEIITFLKAAPSESAPFGKHAAATPFATPKSNAARQPESPVDSLRYGARLLRGFDVTLTYAISVAQDPKVSDAELVLPATLIANAAAYQACEESRPSPSLTGLPGCAAVAGRCRFVDRVAVNRICQALTNARASALVIGIWANFFLEVAAVSSLRPGSGRTVEGGHDRK